MKKIFRGLEMVDPWMFTGLIIGSFFGYLVLGSTADIVDALLKASLKGTQEEISAFYSIVPVLFTVSFGFVGILLAKGIQRLINLILFRRSKEFTQK